MKNLSFCLVFCLLMHTVNATSSIESEAQSSFAYFLDEVEKDDTLTHEEQEGKIQEFKQFSETLSPEVANRLTSLLIEETRFRITDMLQNARLDESEMQTFLDGYDEAIRRVHDMNVEIAREMLFFVAELKIHRQHVYDFGVLLGAPPEQLLRHDLCKLDPDQFEGYVRYFRGGKQDEDKPAYLAAWELHQHEEHHYQSYSKEGFSFEGFSEADLRNNMFESVADWLSSTKQRGGGTLLDYLVNILSKQKPHHRLLPYMEEALKIAHVYYLDSEENPNSDYLLFQGLPCWNEDVEEAFIKMYESALSS